MLKVSKNCFIFQSKVYNYHTIFYFETLPYSLVGYSFLSFFIVKQIRVVFTD